MADQDDDESTMSAFVRGAKSGATDMVRNAIKGAKILTGTAGPTNDPKPFGLAQAIGESHDGFPQ